MPQSLRQKMYDKMCLEIDGGLAPARRAEMCAKWDGMTDGELVDTFYSHAWEEGYDAHRRDVYEG